MSIYPYVELCGEPISFMEGSSERKIAMVEVSTSKGDIFVQPFYCSTGHNSGKAGEWLPFDGLIPTLRGDDGIMLIAFNHYPGRNLNLVKDSKPDASQPTSFLFRKDRFLGHSPDYHLYRYGTQDLKEVSEKLKKMPELSKSANKATNDPRVINRIIFEATSMHNCYGEKNLAIEVSRYNELFDELEKDREGTRQRYSRLWEERRKIPKPSLESPAPITSDAIHDVGADTVRHVVPQIEMPPSTVPHIPPALLSHANIKATQRPGRRKRAASSTL